MANTNDLAVLSLRVYASHPNNNPPLPQGWAPIQNNTEGPFGFAYAVFKHAQTQEIVIAFRGTDGLSPPDWLTNAGLIIAQERQAALVYAQVLQAHGTDAHGSNISFTGHSLGGGLAATMAVWFNRPAVVFDPAPTQAAAQNTNLVNGLLNELGQAAPAALQSYAANIATTFAQHEGNVSSYYAPGSALELFVNDGNTITGAGQRTALQFGNQFMPHAASRVSAWQATS